MATIFGETLSDLIDLKEVFANISIHFLCKENNEIEYYATSQK